MATETATKAPAARRHPLEVTADRLLQHVKDYPQLFDPIALASIDRLVRTLTGAAENGVETLAASAAPPNPGEPFDQRAIR